MAIVPIRLTVPPLLSRYDIDRADELRGDSQALDVAWPGAAVVRIDRKGRFSLVDGALDYALGSDVAESRPADAVFLGRVEDRSVFAVRVLDVAVGGGASSSSDLRLAGLALSETDAAVAAQAIAILNWHASAHFSPVDGAPTEPERGGWVRRNTATGTEEFPRTDAAMITLVHDGGDQVLLGRQAVWPERRFSLFAGFVEPGESLEQCVARELYEEVGVAADEITYVASQPWPFPRSLMLGFTARTARNSALDFRDGEIAEARWFTRDEVRTALEAGDWGSESSDSPLLLPNSISIARAIIEAWVA
ncbi:NAD(+) diphosphatase [Tsukamurella sp. 8F]|uniref:NAD(+) diphosphatase n=1 Tax=unclassified Tsukamurella TaxID=2633480 RepID=UPI0023BA181E|nr:MULTISPECIES: NAD(+) diphosphatase [unclassified Tsukamurella]MDF0528893.1 NAD(+) diphosphatase [Tsukamurella sp. 8J]MDF0586728.1 NAD(+) diphosphatase [Tsukamurella sp. 8F]